MKPFSPRRLLLPLVPLYRLALALRELWLRSGLEPVRRLRWPVLSIGNLSTGGSGKTPLTIALARALTQRGLHVDVLSRGYGRRSQLPARVDPNGTADEFGDEPLLIARETGVPVYVAPQRYDAGVLAEADATRTSQASELPSSGKGTGFSPYINPERSKRALAPEVGSSGDSPSTSAPAVHLLDDGFQHRQLARDVDILLLNRGDWQRQPAARRQPPRASQCHPPRQRSRHPGRRSGTGGGIARLGLGRAALAAAPHYGNPAIDGPVAAFCGIARPEQFFAGLEAAGLRLAVQIAFPDHHRYTVRDLESAGNRSPRFRSHHAHHHREGSGANGRPFRCLPQIPAAQDRPPACRDRARGRGHRVAGRPAEAGSAPPAAVRKSEFAYAVQVSLACGPARRHGRHSARPAGGDGAAAGPSRLGRSIGSSSRAGEPCWRLKAASAAVPASQPLIDQLHLAPTKEWRKAPFSRQTLQ